jgi:CRP-like cAMP-binding protein
MDGSSGNLLLDRLSAPERAAILTRMDLVDLPARTVLAEPGQPMQKVCFPTDGVVSIVTLLSDGEAVEAATCGREGMVGIDVFLGADGTDNVRIISQVSGAGWLIPSPEFQAFCARSDQLRLIMNHYARALLIQANQTAACNGSHTLEERLAKWFLLISDWIGQMQFDLTHEFAAMLLGVYRPSVTLAAGSLQQAGVIEYRRGHVNILHRDKLHGSACECYDVIRRAYDRLSAPLLGEGPGAVLFLTALVESGFDNRAFSRDARRDARTLRERAGELVGATKGLQQRAREIWGQRPEAVLVGG